MAERILGIETSCDETSAAVLEIESGVPQLRSLTILSQDVHRVFGGVVPELASRAHVQSLPAVVQDALNEAEISLDDVRAIAVTQGPGLIGALLTGVMYAKGLSLRLSCPLLGVHHLEGHLFAPTLDTPDLQPPFVALLVSGGHTLLVHVLDWGDYTLLGETRDDAAGEAFDKVGAMLGLDYPGGPHIEHLARKGNASQFSFPRPMIKDGYGFSFSGLKTAVLRVVQGSSDLDADRSGIAAGFQAAVFDVLTEKTARAVEALALDTVVIGGGVACNRTLAERMRERLGEAIRLAVAPPRYNADNAAMIARAGWFRLARGERSAPDFDAMANLPMPGLRRPGPVTV